MLKHIETSGCPKCGAIPIKEEASEECHVNGNRKEERTFACGFFIEHVPNYTDNNGKHERAGGECTRTQKYKDKIQARKDLVSDIKDLVNSTLKDDPSFAERINRELGYMVGNYGP